MGRPALAASVSAALLLGATSLPAAAQAWPTDPASDNAQLITQLFWFTLVVAAVVFVLVEGLLIYSSLRFRRRAPAPVHEPPQIHGNTRLEVMWAAVPALLLVGLFGITLTRMGDLSQLPDPNNANTLKIEVTGQQFSWSFTYGDSGVTTINDLHLPVGQPLLFEVSSKDVIHSFWVPDLYGKIDAIPGRVNRISYTATQVGTFRGVCAQLCGSGHAGMQFRVETLSQGDFQQWLQQQQNGGGAAPAAGAGGADLVQEGKDTIAQEPCGTCHTIPGIQGAIGTVGPSLAGVASRTTIAGGAVPNNGPDDLKKWILNPPAVKPGTAMPNYNLTDQQATAIVAYLETLK